MAKKSRKLTEQEKRLVAFARRSISNHSTFHPDQWRSGNEPADMVIIIGRVMIVFNATEGNSYFPDLVEHNLKQAKDRLQEWRGGRQFRGRNEFKSFAINWTDVDHIAVISVVDGQHRGCCNHDVTYFPSDSKVRICASLTSRVIYEIATKSGGARDLLALCKELPKDSKIGEEVANQKIASTYEKFVHRAKEVAPHEPYRMGRGIIAGKEVSWIEEIKNLIVSLRLNSSQDFDVFSDISWEDIFQICAYTQNVAARIEWLKDGKLEHQHFGKNYGIQVVVSSSSVLLNRQREFLFKQAVKHKCRLVLNISLTPIGPIPFVLIMENPCHLNIETEMLGYDKILP